MLDTSNEVFSLLSILIGFICIIIGLTLYLMNKGIGEKNEIQIGKFILKGSGGLLFAGLGVILILAGTSGQNSLSNSSPDVNDQKHIPQETPQQPEVTESLTSSTPTAQPTPVVQEGKITKDYLLGTWISIQPYVSEKITFYSNDYLTVEEVLSTGETINNDGYYSIYDSQLIFKNNIGITVNFPITYIDQNTFFMQNTYTRI